MDTDAIEQTSIQNEVRTAHAAHWLSFCFRQSVPDYRLFLGDLHRIALQYSIAEGFSTLWRYGEDKNVQYVHNEDQKEEHDQRLGLVAGHRDSGGVLRPGLPRGHNEEQLHAAPN